MSERVRAAKAAYERACKRADEAQEDAAVALRELQAAEAEVLQASPPVLASRSGPLGHTYAPCSVEPMPPPPPLNDLSGPCYLDGCSNSAVTWRSEPAAMAWVPACFPHSREGEGFYLALHSAHRNTRGAHA